MHLKDMITQAWNTFKNMHAIVRGYEGVWLNRWLKFLIIYSICFRCDHIGVILVYMFDKNILNVIHYYNKSQIDMMFLIDCYLILN
jgi:hypothetical protein